MAHSTHIPNVPGHGGHAGSGQGERVLGALFQSMPDPMAVLDGAGRVLETNAAWRAEAAATVRCGTFPCVGVSYLEAAEATRTETGVATAAALRRVLSEDLQAVELEYPCPRSLGVDRLLTVRADAVSVEGERRILVTQRRAEPSAQASRELEPSGKELEALFEQASDGILIVDVDTHRILKSNQRAADLFGYNLPRLLELTLDELVDPEQLRQRPIDLPRTRGGGHMIKERRGLRADGRLIDIEISARRLKDGRILGLVRDVTVRKRRAAALREQTVQLAERVKEQRTLYAVSRILQQEGELGDVLQQLVERLPEGWQQPALAEARVSLGDLQCATAGFTDSAWMLRCPIVVEGRQRGHLEVAYRQRPSSDPSGSRSWSSSGARPDPVFLREEEELLGEVAARIGEAARRHQAEQRLRRSEAYFRTLTEKAVDMITIADADGIARYLSPTFENVLGYSTEERLGQSIFDLIHPEDADQVRHQFKRTAREPSHQPTVQFRILNASGDWCVLESTGRNLLDDPAIGGVVIESRDITARREAEGRIRFQAQLLDSVGQAVVASDSGGRIIYWNRAAEDLYGWPREEVLGRQVTEVLHMEADDPGAGRLRDAVAHERRWVGEVSVRRRDGSMVPLLVADEPIQGEDGEFAGYVAVASDLSELNAAEWAVRESEERLRAVVENASDVTLVLRSDGTVTYSSPNRRRVLGDEVDAAIRRGLELLDVIHPEDRTRGGRLWRRVLARPGVTSTAELRVLDSDGSWRLLEVSALSLLDNPAVGGVVVHARDVTERAHLEQQLQQAQKMEAIGSLAGGIAHDFNNLLTGVQGYTQLALESLPEDHSVHGYLKEVERATTRAASLTRQLLAFSRRQVLQPRVVDANRTVRELEGMLARLIGEDIRLVTELEEGVGSVHVDPGQLEQVIVNLAVNGRDAMPQGGTLTVATRSEVLEGQEVSADGEPLPPGRYVALTVEDSGTGMQAAVIERVFEPFFTTKELGKGTGLGLSTVYGIVRQSGGLVRVESEPGSGSLFCVLLPEVSPAERAVEEPRPELPTAQSPDPRETVLLVEDDDAVRRLALRVLEGRGYRVLSEPDGALGLRRFVESEGAGEHIAAVISDVVMPGLGGRELAERVHEIDPDRPVLLMSGYTDDVLVRHGVHTLGVDFLEKPFTPAQLIGRVQAMLSGSSVTPAGDG